MEEKRNEEINKIYENARARGVLVDINANMYGNDEFKAPMLDFDITQNFDEICNKKILSPEDKDKSFLIKQALQNIQFQMDEAGVKLKSEAAMEVDQDLGLPEMDIEPIQPRYFHYTGRYAIFVAEDVAREPYFAMLVNDPSALQANKEDTNSEKKDPEKPSDLPRVKPPEGYQPKPANVPPKVQPINNKELQDVLS